MFRQSRMQSDRNAFCKQIQPLYPRSAQGLDGSNTEEPQNHPPSRIRHVRCGRRYHQAEIDDAVMPVAGWHLSTDRLRTNKRAATIRLFWKPSAFATCHSTVIHPPTGRVNGFSKGENKS